MKILLIQLCHNHKPSTEIYSYQSDWLLQLRGVSIPTSTTNQTSLSTKFHIFKRNQGSLQVKQTAIALDPLRIGSSEVTTAISVLSDNIIYKLIIDKFNTVFQGVELLKNFELQLHTDPTIVSV